MGDIRRIKRYIDGKMGSDGAGVSLRRCFGYHDIPDFDPFLMMDFFDSTNPADYIRGFPWHPHRGIETITYLISGEIEHEDSLGNRGTIKDGDCQWMTAGSGILHQEMPKESSKMLGTQIWLNLPQKDKMTKPRYRDISKDMIPVYEDDDIRVHIIAGKFKDIIGPLELEDTRPIFWDIELEANREFKYDLDPSLNAFAFLVEGEAKFDVETGEMVSSGRGVLYGDGEEIVVRAGNNGGRFFLLAGKPLGEPIAWGGPIVMNTREELDLAFKELDEGNFIK